MIAGNYNPIFMNSGNSSGQQEFVTNGTHNFTVPDGVTSVSAVCVGSGSTSLGGSLRYITTLAVTPGEVLTVSLANTAATKILRSGVVLLSASGGTSGPSSTIGGNIGGGNGGFDGSGSLAGEGGAGGYSGNGGNGGASGSPTGSNGTPGSGGGGGGGGGKGGGVSESGVGGGVGLKGAGSNGAGGVGGNYPDIDATPGSPGSGGVGQLYGGGGINSQGGCRIIWGAGRAYPSTNTADV